MTVFRILYHAMERGPLRRVIGVSRNPFICIPSDDLPTSLYACLLDGAPLGIDAMPFHLFLT
jgi:hypothetical protein